MIVTVAFGITAPVESVTVPSTSPVVFWGKGSLFVKKDESVNAGWMDLGIAGTEHVAGTTSAPDVFAAAQNTVKL